MKVFTRNYSLMLMVMTTFVLSAHAVPIMINYQGNIEVNRTPFNGTGLFRFAIVDGTGNQYWSNDGNNPPSNNVSINVESGFYFVILGDTETMDSIPLSLFDHDDIYLRIWFDDGEGTGIQQLSPDRKITSVGFAIKAKKAEDADTVDGVHAIELEESAEIDTKIAVHASEASVHHVKTTLFSELTDTATDAQIPDSITINYALESGNADSIDGQQYDENWPTTQSNIKTALSNDFHNIGGSDDDQPDGDSEVPDAISINNGSLYAVSNKGNVGIGTTNPEKKLHIAGDLLCEGNVSAHGIPGYSNNSEALAAGLSGGSFYHTGSLLKIVFVPGQLYSVDNIAGNMRYVIEGAFTQGSPESEPCRSSNETQFTHILTRNLAVMETEITRQMWADLRAVQPSLPADPTYLGYGSGMSNPTQSNTWYEAVLFANLLSIQNGLTPCYYRDEGFLDIVDSTDYINDDHYWNFNADGYRLPTEGEWEYFCRAGTTGSFSCSENNYTSGMCDSCTASDWQSPNSNEELWTHAVFCANDPGRSEPIGSKLSNLWNLKDVHGNVMEWCWDWFGNYPSGPETDYKGPSSGASRVKRGGGWSDYPRYCRSANRGSSSPATRNYRLGFRLERIIP